MARQHLNLIRTQQAEETIKTAVRPFTPHPPSAKQRAFLALDCLEAGYGGAAGGGKSDALIMGALQYVDVPGYAAILFRKTKTDLERAGALKNRCDTWFAGTAAKWDDSLYGYRFPTLPGKPDATISFGYWLPGSNASAQAIQSAKDRYQGAEWQYIGIDELGQWRRADYLFLFSRLRPLKRIEAVDQVGGEPRRRVPVRMRSSFNPGGVGHEDNKARFIAHARQDGTGLTYEQYNAARKRKEPLHDPPYFRSPPSKEVEEISREFGIKPEGPTFVPAFASDNPGLDLGAYKVNLALLDPVERRQLDDGDWDAIATGKFFADADFRYCEPGPNGGYVDDEGRALPRVRATVRFWDLAATDPAKALRRGKDPDWTAGAKVSIAFELGKRPEGKPGETRPPPPPPIVIIEDVRAFRKDPAGVDSELVQTAREDGKRVPIAIEQEPGSSGKMTISHFVGLLMGWIVEGDPTTGPKEAYWKPLSVQARNGRMYLVRGPWNAGFKRELCALPDGGHDDQADAASKGFAKLTGNVDALRARLMALAR